MGAWIEISLIYIPNHFPQSHPTWVRGLKLPIRLVIIQLNSRTPHGCVDWNNPTTPTAEPTEWSHPTWVRGLKLMRMVSFCMEWSRTPHGCVDWNILSLILVWLIISRTPHGCVDWNFQACLSASTARSHPTWVRGLKSALDVDSIA